MINKACHGHKEERSSNRHLFAISEPDAKGTRNRPVPTRSRNSSKHCMYVTFPHSISVNQVQLNKIRKQGKIELEKKPWKSA